MSRLDLSNALPSTQIHDLSDYVFTTRYARYDFKKKRRETWDEAVDRVRDMHLFRYASKGIDDDIKWAFDQVRDKRVLPSMRSMQFGGEAIIVNDARMYNCAFTHADRQRFFSEGFWMLLSGCGIGFSVQKQHVAKLPKLVEFQSPDEKEVVTYTVGDTIEGWADALDMLVQTFFRGNPISGKEIFFDFSKIRRKGSWLKTSGGRAPGATPLRIALKRIKKILRDAVEAGQEMLRPIQVYDMMMMAADAVLSGGIRRSATIALFSYDDEEMMTAKTFYQTGKVLSNQRKDGTWLTEYGVAINLKHEDGSLPVAGDECGIGWFNIKPWRARSNNSVALLRDQCTLSQFQQVMNHAKIYGEPGFVFLDNLDYGYNPCVEIGLNPICPETGQTGWGVCNLTEINGSRIKTKEDFMLAVRAAATIGTLQAGYTYLHYLTDTTRRVVERERLLGVSVTGWLENPDLLLDPDLQTEMAQLAVQVNQEVADKIGIQHAARVTCTKPAGNSASVLGTCSGHSPWHAPLTLRRVQSNKVEQPLQYFKLFNPDAVEPSVWGAEDECLTFCLQAPDTAIFKSDLTAIEYLELVKSTVKHWVWNGTAYPDSSPGLKHNVSNTVVVGPEEWDEVAIYLYENREFFSGVSLLARTGDKSYEQAPFEKVETPEDIEKWNHLVSNFNKVPWDQLRENEDYTSHREIVACAGGACET